MQRILRLAFKINKKMNVFCNILKASINIMFLKRVYYLSETVQNGFFKGPDKQFRATHREISHFCWLLSWTIFVNWIILTLMRHCNKFPVFLNYQNGLTWQGAVRIENIAFSTDMWSLTSKMLIFISQNKLSIQVNLSKSQKLSIFKTER